MLNYNAKLQLGIFYYPLLCDNSRGEFFTAQTLTHTLRLMKHKSETAHTEMLRYHLPYYLQLILWFEIL